MTDKREQLIEEATDAMFTANDGQLGQGYDEMARAALSVFEQAHTAHAKPLDTSPEPVKNGGDSLHVTPTDDEREVTEDALWDVVERLSLPLTGVEVQALAESVARRTVQGEPTDAQVRAAYSAYEAVPRDINTSALEYMRAALRAAAATQTGENR